MKINLFIIAIFLITSQGQTQTITIGNQVWMTKNLNVDKFRNGDIIPEVKTKEEWKIAGEKNQPAWCYFNNDKANGEKYGKLYNWAAVNDPRGLAPYGWHIPSETEWMYLINYLGGENISGSKMKSKSGWPEPENEIFLKSDNGTNESGFSALPGGERYDSGEFPFIIGHKATWWSSTLTGESIQLPFNVVLITNIFTGGAWYGTGCSVRCIQDRWK
jgi:uncharacterized protein (TIGR02145 family)